MIPNIEDFEGVNLRNTCLDTTHMNRFAEQLLKNIFSTDEQSFPSLKRDYMWSYKPHLYLFFTLKTVKFK